MQAKNQEDVKFGFTPSAENLNGQLATIGFIAAVVTELVTGQGTLHFLGLM
jgi:hypothetical protein